MRIVIDMQGAQSTARFRGIGRYTMNFVKAIVKNCRQHDVILALNGYFPETIAPIRQAFKDLLPQENICVWQPPIRLQPKQHGLSGRNAQDDIEELIYEAFLTSLQPDIIHICSLIEAYSVTSIGRLKTNAIISVALHDLIPLINPEKYLDNNIFEKEYYLQKIDHLRRASLLLAISESSRQEAIKHLDFPLANTVNISSAADTMFQPIKISKQAENDLLRRYGLQKEFVMHLADIDERKNIDGLIKAYAKLPKGIRAQHQLAIICKLPDSDHSRLRGLAKKVGLAKDELILTGFVADEDLLLLYNLCKLFAFPSLHEGFGLPVLEAMACGAVTITSNTSSLPEAAGLEDALFDPYDVSAITVKLQQALTDDIFRAKLIEHGQQHAKKFSWKKTAITAIKAWEEHHTIKLAEKTAHLQIIPNPLPLLAYVSPMPLAQSGIADYSAELLTELSKYYRIELIIEQSETILPSLADEFPVRNVEWFMMNKKNYARVLYHFGNSPYHQHMFDLIKQVPGTIVLHDFFLSGLIAHEAMQKNPQLFINALYESHGYISLYDYSTVTDFSDVVMKYPINQTIFQHAQGIIVHSDYSRYLASYWYNIAMADNNLQHIPLLRIKAETSPASRKEARKKLGLGEHQLIVCSFGILDPTKQNQRLLNAWHDSALKDNENAMLIFIGSSSTSKYCDDTHIMIQQSICKDRIKVTGRIKAEIFKLYLQAADIGVQLRNNTRGETSASVLDCMNYGLATIINAHGSLAEIPDEAVWKLPDNFTDAELINALTILSQDEEQRITLGKQAQQIIHTMHAPAQCAKQYYHAIENFHHQSSIDVPTLLEHITALDVSSLESQELIHIAQSIDHSIKPKFALKQIFIDVSAIIISDLGTGIQRVVRSILTQWLHNPPAGYRIEPVYATENVLGYRYARNFTLGLLNIPRIALDDDPINFYNGDCFFALDMAMPMQIPQGAFYQRLRRSGVQVIFLIYDLLPILQADYFPDWSENVFHQWINVINQNDGAICISETVATELQEWLQENTPPQDDSFTIQHFHLGADIKTSTQNNILSNAEQEILNSITGDKNFLMVATIEPRKGHEQVLDAFEKIWQNDKSINLIFIGKQGWNVESLLDRLQNHPLRDKNIFWFTSISDALLECFYNRATCLIVASYAEGFGLPLIEAAQYKLPIIARDIPVFREVAQEHAYYFDASSAEQLQDAIMAWLALYQAGKHPISDALPYLSWDESAANLMDKILNLKSEKE